MHDPVRALTLVVLVVVSFSASAARAEDPLSARLGLQIGEPLSLTFGYTISERFVVHVEAGASTARYEDAVAAADLVYWIPDILGGELGKNRFAPWFGLGLRVSAGKDEEPNRFGFRIPAGISYITGDHGIEVYVSIAPGVSVTPNDRASLDGGIGLRVGF